ncbi:MAG TPA: hypothetical protein VM055_00240, partial [Novosphingobium sp.]|nr:hypothetical protein [Novosphingobium sp.]
MDAARDDEWEAALAASQAWWREAGVDMAFADAPRNWLETARKPATAIEPAAPVQAEVAFPPPIARIGGDRARWPNDLAQFADWWLTEPSLDPAGLALRVPPAGPKQAPLMVLVAQPEAGDRDTL